MNILHSYVLLEKVRYDKELLLKTIKVSLHFAKQTGHRVVFYGNLDMIILLKSNNIQYDEFKVIPEEFCKKFEGFAAACKFYAITDQTEPCLHIDCDTFLFNINIEENDIVFGHRDLGPVDCQNRIQSFLDSYIIPMGEVYNDTSVDFRNFNLWEIPNMCYIKVNNLKKFKKISKLVLNNYLNHIDKWLDNSWIVVEQYHTGYFCKRNNVHVSFLHKQQSVHIEEGKLMITYHEGEPGTFNPSDDTRYEVIPENYKNLTYMHPSGYWLEKPEFISWLNSCLPA